MTRRHVPAGSEAHRHDCVHNQVAKKARDHHDPDTAEKFQVSTCFCSDERLYMFTQLPVFSEAIWSE